jgi:tetratricopeptide (TPR) repeat protein
MATEARRTTLGEDDPRTLAGGHNLATIYEKLGRYGEAETMYRRALEGKRRVLGAEHPYTIATVRALAAMYWQRENRRSEAESLLRNAFDGLRKSAHPDPNSAETLAGQLASLYDAWGKPSQAAEWRKKLPPQ